MCHAGTIHSVWISKNPLFWTNVGLNHVKLQSTCSPQSPIVSILLATLKTRIAFPLLMEEVNATKQESASLGD